MGVGHIVGPAGNGANVGGLAAVEAHMLIENATAHSVALHIVEVAGHHGSLLFTLLFGNGLEEVVVDLVKRVVTPVLVGVASLGNLIALGVALFTQTGLDVLVVYLVAVFALHNAQFFGHLLLDEAHGFDGVVSGLQGGNQVFFLHFVHLAFHHHDVIVSCTYH